MTILFLDVVKDGFVNDLFGSTLLASVALLVLLTILLFKAKVPAHMIFIILLPVVIGYASFMGIFASYIYGVWIVIAGLVLGMIYLGLFRDN